MLGELSWQKSFGRKLLSRIVCQDLRLVSNLEVIVVVSCIFEKAVFENAGRIGVN